MVKDIVLVGASSDIAIEFSKNEFDEFVKVHKISTNSNFHSDLKVYDYLENINIITKYFSKLENPLVIFFNGYLKENRPYYKPNSSEIMLTLKINFEIPYKLAEQLYSLNPETKFIFISSIAAIKPRFKNFIYGFSKQHLENSIKEMKGLNYLIIRFGKVNTRMSAGHKDPPFSLSKKLAAKLIYKNLNNNGLVHPTFGLKFSYLLINFLPITLINYIETKFINK